MREEEQLMNGPDNQNKVFVLDARAFGRSEKWNYIVGAGLVVH